MNPTQTNTPRFYRVGDCLILSEQSRFCAVPFDVAEKGAKVTFYHGADAHQFTPEAFLKWQAGELESPLNPAEVFAQHGRGDAVKSLTLRLALRIDSYKTDKGGFVAVVSSPLGLELASFTAPNEAAALQAASNAFMPPKGMEG